jgi:BirA family biotin operon repressor/biotin-[acetyl-CoA-carboxylase] ligase
MAPQPHTPIDIERLRRVRQHARLGHTIHYLDSTGSTNDVARELALDGAPEGTVVIAEAQTKGRGRLQRSWVSPPLRNLYLSAVLRPAIEPALAAQIGLVAGLATAEAVREWSGDAAIKWPNDVVIGRRKVAGLLTEMDAGDDLVRFVVAGIGVNLNSTEDDFPPELRSKAVSLGTCAGAPIDRTGFAERLLSQLEERYDCFLAEGFAALRPAWQSLSCLTGRNVQIDNGGQRQEGLVIGIAADGALLLRRGDGSESRIVAGDVTVVDGYAFP